MQRTFLVTLILVVAGLAGLPVAAHAASYPFHPAGPIRCDSATGTVTAYPSNDVQSWYSTTETVWWSSELVWWNARTQTWDPADLTDWGWLTATAGPNGTLSQALYSPGPFGLVSTVWTWQDASTHGMVSRHDYKNRVRGYYYAIRNYYYWSSTRQNAPYVLSNYCFLG